MGDNLVPNGFVEGLQGFLLQVEVTEIIVHEAGEPNAVVDFLDAKFLAGQHGGDVDPLAMQAEASLGGDENLAVMEVPAGRHMATRAHRRSPLCMICFIAPTAAPVG
jgi:hypothetical protein